MKRYKKYNAKIKYTSAFTLIELLVVIAIISLLVSILIPSLTKAKELAQEVVCLSNIRGIDLAFKMYIEDNNEWLVHYRCNPDFVGTINSDWAKYYNQYLNLSPTGSDGLAQNATTDSNILDCPSATTYGYALNIDIGDPSPNPPYGIHPISIEENPELLLRMAEPKDNWLVNAGLCNYSDLYPSRHRDGAHYLFCDGHTEWLPAFQIVFRWWSEKEPYIHAFH